MKMTKEESIKWINHAIAFYKGLGKTQKELAKDFGIEESRLSELKSVHKPLKVSPSQVRKIIEICGAPKRDPGRFENVELYDSLDSFFNQYISVTLNRFHRDVYESLTNKAIVNEILKKCSYKNDDKEQQVEAINQLVRSKEFAEICKDASLNSKLIGSSKNEFSLITKLYGLIINDSATFHRLRQLWSLVEVLPEFQFGNETNNGLDLIVPKTPVVLTGNRIAAFMPDYSRFDYPANRLVKSELSVLMNGYLSAVEPIPELDIWQTIRVEIYLSENMNYHILIHMSDDDLKPRDLSHESTVPEGFDWCNYDAAFGEKDRIAVIRSVNTLDLFSQIEELRKWQGLEVDNLYELKRNIAKAGGHIPGAHVLI
ncbi:helix-turn-helix domain-containing protein [Vibrio vulnificus]|uniref:helix-turn-helix domain-containing protein n=1 Tax=Vibrio vulnificus TaxID=672 RepID=UPI003ED9073C